MGHGSITINREDTPNGLYVARYDVTHLSNVAKSTRGLPDAFISSSGHNVTPAFSEWAMPLIGGPDALPAFERL